MVYSILQSFLDNRFIKTDDPEHIIYLEKSSAAVLRLLKQKKNKPKIINYTLVALDPTISDDEPIVAEVEALIIKNWPAFRNSVVKTKDTPIAYVQAVILEALSKLSYDEELAAIIWLTGRNIIDHYNTAGQENVLTCYLLDMGNRVEEAARNNWRLLEGTQIDMNIVAPDISPGKVSSDKIQGHFKAGAIHTSWGQGGESQYTPNQATVGWPSFFSERTGGGIAKEINAALAVQSKSLTSVFSAIQKIVGSYLENISLAVFQSSQSLNKRSDLLWWKQALYSQRLDSSYRTLAPLSMSTAMAVDLADNVSPIYPRSVDYFLKETLRGVLGKEVEQKTTLAALLEELQNFSGNEKSLLKGFCNTEKSRKPLARIIHEPSFCPVHLIF